MRILTTSLAAVSLMALAAPASAQQARPAPILTTPEAKDVWTHARPEIARVTHVSLDLTADFTAKTMAGKATLDILAAKGAKEIVLDIDDLAISAITDARGRKLA